MTEVYVISDFNADLLSRYITADASIPEYRGSSAPFDQVFQTLTAQPPVGVGAFGLIWTRPEGVLPVFARVLAGEIVDPSHLTAAVDEFADYVKSYARHFKALFVTTWIQSRERRGLGMLDWTQDGQAYLLAKLNLQLAEALAGANNIFLLDAGRWVDRGQPLARDDKYWFTMKSPFTERVFQIAAKDVAAAIRGCLGRNRKLVVVDLDDTLWGGIVGDDGRDNLRLGGHDAVGEAYVEFQHALKELTNRGIQVALLSKNDEATALEVFSKHSAMVLKTSDLAGWRIDWNDKAQNLADLVKDLNLGLHSVVFIDDNPIERGRIQEAFPEVLVPEWPKDPTRYAQTLRQLDCFDQPAITAEDRARTQMYVQDRERKDSVRTFTSPDEWLQSLNVKIKIVPLGEINRKRAIQLLNKTSQMNLSGRKLTESEALAWLSAASGREFLALNVSDRFGDLGLTGVISWQRNGADLEIVDFVLSCRAMGRRVEETMLRLAVDRARDSGENRIVARAVPTSRNSPCMDFWRKSGFTEAEPNVFMWSAELPYPTQAHVTLLRAA